MPVCQECGKAIPEGAALCRYCGEKLAHPSELTPPPVEKAKQPPNVIMAICRCNRTKEAFVINFERKKRNKWVATTGMTISEQRVNGALRIASASYPMKSIDISHFGCPLCGANTFVKCGCSRLTCWNQRGTWGSMFAERRLWTCAWCGATGNPTPGNFSISGGTDF